jgi:hypothetical protein
MAAIITPITSPNYFPSKYNANELNLIPSFLSKTAFNSDNCYIESLTFNLNNDLLFLTYDYTDYVILNDGQSAGSDGALSKIIIDPENDLINNGLETPNGEYIVLYNFFQKRIGTPSENLYISEISSDRTEIRLDSINLNSTQLQSQAEDFIIDRDISPYFQDFYLNFGINKLILANNILVDLDNDPTSPSVLVKLYQPLPEEFEINQPLWIVTSIEESKAYKIKFPLVPIEFEQNTDNILYPNFNLDIKDQVNNSTLSLSYTDLILTSLTSSLNQLNSLFEEKEIDINVDYTDFSNFVHFSSAQTRIENFYYKIQLIEEYSESILNLNLLLTSPTSESKANYESKINSIITNFDGYEYFLYYENNSKAWPKSNTQKPYQLYNSNSDQVLSWLGTTNYDSPFYGGQLYSASNYDNLNKDNLFYTIPEYLREDPANNPYQLFIEMVGQHYDNIWVYYRDISQKYNADNRLENGISKDLITDAIKDFGIKLYQNNFSNEDLYTAFLGLTPEGGLFPFPNITGSLPTPSGYEYINTKISASNDYLPLDDVNKSLYKRIYHNLPYLLQTKGTLPGLRALITSYGIPDTILRIKEYGGKDKTNTNDWDYWQNEFNYAYKQNGNNFIFSSFVLNSSWGATSNNPETVMFRFKTNGLPTSSIPYSQSLFLTKITGAPTSTITLRYTGSAYSTGSYSGSIVDPYYQYAYLDFHPDATATPNLSASIYLPFFDGDWWSVIAKKTGTGVSTNFELYSGNKMYDGGENGTSIGFFDSSLVIADDSNYNLAIQSNFGSGSITVNSKIYNSFSGSFQEIRYYSKPISESVFKDFIMNPSSIEGNTLNSGANQLAFRLPLGGELYTGSNSIHPKVTGSWVTTSSFASNSTAFFNLTPTFVSNTEYFYYDQPIAGIKNAIADKIRVENNVIPEGDVLSPFMSLSQQANISQSYTANTNLLEVAFSPQDEVNDDINSSLGYFNIGEYIGDPRLRSSSAESYPSLDALRDSYFQKYTKNYNLVDFVRLIKFFDNSLFKMIKDFVPARTSLASGIVIKQHILERNKVPQPQVNNYSTIAYYASGSTKNKPLTFQDISVSGTLLPQWNDYNAGTIENFDGGTAGVFEMFNGTAFAPSGSNIFNLTQSWSELIQNASGSINIIHNSQDEFYNGEFDGSVLTVTTQSLNAPYPNSPINFNYTPVRYSQAGYGFYNDLYDDPNPPFAENQFLNSLTSPDPGEILLLTPWFQLGGMTPGGAFLPNQSGPIYVKIHKFDNNGVNNDIALGQATKLRIKYTTLSDYVTIGNILTITEYPTYYLYKVQSLGSDTADNYIKNYNVSASNVTPVLLPSPVSYLNSFNTISGNTLGFYNNTTGFYTNPQTPNVKLNITASITTSGSVGALGVLLLGSNGSGNIKQEFITTGANITTTISASYYPLGADQLYLAILQLGNLTLKSGSFLITQSIAPSSQEYDPIIIEPYITEPNFYNSDDNALLNSISDQRESTFALDVDYGYGTTPTNFGLLISGTATPSTVPDSNYTSKKSTILKYEGSKSTSQLLNTWSPSNTIEGYSDTGTYGKLPTIESLKTVIAYCDGIGGWAPEKENASAMNVLFLIKADGTVVIPNTSEDSLSIMQQTFQTGERVFISTKNIATSPLYPYRTIIRGGSHIEPILYTQSGSAPNAKFSGSIELIDTDLTNGGVSANYSALYKVTQTSPVVNGTEYNMAYNTVIYGPAISSPNSSFAITQPAVNEGVSFTFRPIVYFLMSGPSNVPVTVSLKLYKNSVISTNLISSTTQTVSIIPFQPLFAYYTAALAPVTVNNSNLLAGDKYFVMIKFSWTVPAGSQNIAVGGIQSAFSITQYPVYTTPFSSSGYNTIWGYGNKVTHPYIITSSKQQLVDNYENPDIIMKSVSGSGFNQIQLPWSIKFGDEFRFEGREDWSYMVKNIFGPAESGSGRIFQTGSIEVHFDANLPVSASSNVFNLDHFLIRRYVDDAAQNVIAGFKPPDSMGPYLIKPEFVVPELNKSIDEVILDLTQKGLIT